MPAWRANQSISLFGNLAFLNRDNSYSACAIGRTIGRFEVDSYEFHCIALVKVKFLWILHAHDTRSSVAAGAAAPQLFLRTRLGGLAGPVGKLVGHVAREKTSFCSRSRAAFRALICSGPMAGMGIAAIIAASCTDNGRRGPSYPSGLAA